MLEESVVKYCSPTLAGIKTGNLFSIKRKSASDVYAEINCLNRKLTKMGIRAIPAKRSDAHTLVYLYRPDLLKRDLGNPEVTKLLSEKGYCCDNESLCVVQLMRHLCNDEDFPHEIGLFLGYPPSDVKCFMENPNAEVKCVGCWKVYGDEARAKTVFERYQRCTDYYSTKIKQGASLEKLIVKSGNLERKKLA